MKKIVVNIGRQYASGGHEIGALLAKELDVEFYDKELITITSQESGLCEECFKEVDEKGIFNRFGNFLNPESIYFSEDNTRQVLTSENLFRIQSETILRLAEEKSAVFVGRCADYVLRNHPHAMNVFITADINQRVLRSVERGKFKEGLKTEDIASAIEKYDKKRAEYYNYFSDKKWGDSRSYHLTLNSGLLGIVESAKLLAHIVKQAYLK